MKKLKLALIIILLLCLADMPYGYYAFVRFASMVGFGILSYDYYKQNNNQLAVTFAVLSLLFQPFIKIALGKEIWIVVDIVVAIFLAVLALRKTK